MKEELRASKWACRPVLGLTVRKEMDASVTSSGRPSAEAEGDSLASTPTRPWRESLVESTAAQPETTPRLAPRRRSNGQGCPAVEAVTGMLEMTRARPKAGPAVTTARR